jgi:hypothetical protein
LIESLLWPFSAGIAFTLEYEFKYVTKTKGRLYGTFDLPCHVIAAASWIERAGPQLYSVFEMGVEAFAQDECYLRSCREDFNGNKLSFERWRFWKQQLRMHANRDDLPLEVRGRARAAVAVMNGIEWKKSPLRLVESELRSLLM